MKLSEHRRAASARKLRGGSPAGRTLGDVHRLRQHDIVGGARRPVAERWEMPNAEVDRRRPCGATVGDEEVVADYNSKGPLKAGVWVERKVRHAAGGSESANGHDCPF